MAFHQIQCPHCFTDYTISDEQYRNTDGVVRCGTCREQFKAIVITKDGTPPKFDPRDVFIEPLSEPLAAAEGGDKKLTGEPDASYVSYEKAPDTEEDSNIELMSTHEFEYTGPPEPVVPEDIAAEYGDSNELSTSQILRNLRERQGDNGNGASGVERTESANHQQGQFEFKTTHEEPSSMGDTTPLSQKSDQPQPDADVNLIDAVDELVEQKLVPTGSKTEGSLASKDNDFFLEPRRRRRSKKSVIRKVFGFMFWMVVSLVLITALLYQLWLKQLVNLPTDQPWFQKIATFAEPYFARAEKELVVYDVVIPQRRNLSQLELVSAQTEPHPTRATTVLLKVSIVNRAEITQPLPWLEMTLTDADGRLVSRRNLSPQDYIYNNRTSSNIGPTELKKITIELLSFPKTATGYEIKLLNK